MFACVYSINCKFTFIEELGNRNELMWLKGHVDETGGGNRGQIPQRGERCVKNFEYLSWAMKNSSWVLNGGEPGAIF